VHPNHTRLLYHHATNTINQSQLTRHLISPPSFRARADSKLNSTHTSSSPLFSSSYSKQHTAMDEYIREAAALCTSSLATIKTEMFPALLKKTKKHFPESDLKNLSECGIRKRFEEIITPDSVMAGTVNPILEPLMKVILDELEVSGHGRAAASEKGARNVMLLTRLCLRSPSLVLSLARSLAHYLSVFLLSLAIGCAQSFLQHRESNHP
jgi:hypothetical protein